jgi:hypothetical protein
MKTVEQEENSKDTYYTYASTMWLKNKKRYRRQDGSKSSYYYTCKKEGCKEPRVLNEKTDPEYEISIRSQYCKLHHKPCNN